MLRVDLDSTGVLSYLGAIDDRIVDALLTRVDLLTQVLVERIQSNLDGMVLQRRTGRLYESVVRTEPSYDGANIDGGTVTAATGEASYGEIFETGGLGEYSIVPVNAKVLAFMLEGKKRFAMIVHHPPAPELPWFSPEVEWAKRAMVSQLNQAVKEAL